MIGRHSWPHALSRSPMNAGSWHAYQAIQSFKGASTIRPNMRITRNQPQEKQAVLRLARQGGCGHLQADGGQAGAQRAQQEVPRLALTPATGRTLAGRLSYESLCQLHALSHQPGGHSQRHSGRPSSHKPSADPCVMFPAWALVSLSHVCPAVRHGAAGDGPCRRVQHPGDYLLIMHGLSCM